MLDLYPKLKGKRILRLPLRMAGKKSTTIKYLTGELDEEDIQAPTAFSVSGRRGEKIKGAHNSCKG